MALEPVLELALVVDQAGLELTEIRLAFNSLLREAGLELLIFLLTLSKFRNHSRSTPCPLWCWRVLAPWLPNTVQVFQLSASPGPLEDFSFGP